MNEQTLGGALNSTCRSKLTEIVTVLLSILFIFSGCIERKKELPPDYKPQIITGITAFEKSNFLSSNDTGIVTDIKVIKTHSTAKSIIATAGRKGAVITDRKGQLIKSIKFIKHDDWKSNFEVIYSKKTDSCYFFGTPNISWYYGLFDDNGREMWRKKTNHEYGAAYGDLNNDGNTEFLISYQNKINVLDLYGNMLFEIPGYSSSSVIVDEERHEILSQPGSKLVVLDNKGILLRSSDIKGALTFIGYLNAQSQIYPLLYEEKNTYVRLTPDGKARFAQYRGAHYLSDAKATMVRFDSKQQPYLALTGLILYQGGKWFGLEAILTVLFMFNSKQELVYHEILESRGEAIAAIPTGKANEEALLLGGDGVVWKYMLKK